MRQRRQRMEKNKTDIKFGWNSWLHFSRCVNHDLAAHLLSGNVRLYSSDSFITCKPQHPNISVQSAGVGALINHPISKHAQTLLNKCSIDTSAHSSRQLTEKIIKSSDLILTAESHHQNNITDQFPFARGKIHLIGKWINKEIPDPFRCPIEAYEGCLELIEKGLNEWIKKLKL